MKRIYGVAATAVVVAVALASAPQVYAALTATSTLSQQINAGTLSTDIRDSSNVVVASPSFSMTPLTISTSQQTSTGTLGEANQRLAVDNPGGANNGFSITLAATGGASATWTSGGNTYPFNGASAAAGQLTVNPTPSTWTALTGTTTSITKGASTTFSGGTNGPATIATTSAALEDIWNGYVTGVGLSQTVPANQPAGTYTISMTQTVAAQ